MCMVLQACKDELRLIAVPAPIVADNMFANAVDRMDQRRSKIQCRGVR